MKYSPETKEQMKQLYSSGVTRRAIAEQFGAPLKTVRNITVGCRREDETKTAINDELRDEWNYYTAMILGRKIYKDVYEEWDALNKKYGRASA